MGFPTNNIPTVIDDDQDTITVELHSKELRGWCYDNEDQRRTKMLCAREYVEGWCDGIAWWGQEVAARLEAVLRLEEENRARSDPPGAATPTTDS
jgi:hypothetical protein